VLKANVQELAENPLREGKLKKLGKLTRDPAVKRAAYDGT